MSIVTPCKIHYFDILFARDLCRTTLTIVVGPGPGGRRGTAWPLSIPGRSSFEDCTCLGGLDRSDWCFGVQSGQLRLHCLSWNTQACRWAPAAEPRRGRARRRRPSGRESRRPRPLAGPVAARSSHRLGGCCGRWPVWPGRPPGPGASGQPEPGRCGDAVHRWH